MNTAAEILKGIDFDRVIGWTSPSHDHLDTPRHLNPVLLADGWKGLVKADTKPVVEWLRARGAARPRLLLHNPYGIDKADGHYRFDQRKRCLADKKTAKAASGMSAACKPLIDNGARLIFYTGNFGDVSLKILAAKADDAIRDWEYCVKEAIECGGEIGADASALLPGDCPQWGFLKMLAGFTTLYVEARPAKEHRHLFAFPWICQEHFYHRSNPDKFDDAANLYARNTDLTGECVRYLQFPDDDMEMKWNGSVEQVSVRLADSVRSIQADGHTAALNLTYWRKLQ